MSPRQQQPPDPEPPAAEYVDEDHQRIHEFAQDFLDDDERDEFVDHLMERRGYQRVQSWGPRTEPDPEPDPEPEPQRQRGGRQGGGGQQARRPARAGYFKH